MLTKLFASFVAGMVLAALMGCDGTRVASVSPDLSRAEEIRAALRGGASAEDGDGGSADAAQPTGWATLRGSFTFAGDAPARMPLTQALTKDSEVCAPGGSPPLAESFVVGPNGGIKDVVIYLSSDVPAEEPWTHPSAAPGKTEEVIFDQKQCVFLSHVIGMQASQPLKILNSDPVGHNTNINPTSNVSFNQNIAAGGSSVYQPSKEENSPASVACSIHPWMSAYLLIRENSYFAVSQPDGTFEIPNLPAGVELEFRVWQEAANFVQNVSLNGSSQKWSKGRFTLTLDPTDESKNEIQVTLSSSIFQ